MTYVSTPNSGALPRRRVFKPGSFGAIALVVAMGAAIAGGIAISNDEAQPATATVSPSGDTFTKQREGAAATQTMNSADRTLLNKVTTGAAVVDSADKGYLGRGAELARQEFLAPSQPGQPG